MMCGDGTPGRKNRGREGVRGGSPQAGFSWEGRGGGGQSGTHHTDWSEWTDDGSP